MQLSENSSLKIKILSDITYNINKHVSKHIKLANTKTTSTLSLFIDAKRNRLLLFAESQHPQCNTKNNFKKKHRTGLYNKLTYPALEGKSGNCLKNSLKKADSSTLEESISKDLGPKVFRTLKINVIMSSTQNCNIVSSY